MSDSSTANSVILYEYNTWRPWKEMMKSTAAELELWQYINPDSTMIPELVPPVKPQPSHYQIAYDEQAEARARAEAMKENIERRTAGQQPIHDMEALPRIMRTTLFGDLSEDSQAMLHMDLKDYKYARNIHDAQAQGLRKMRIKIQETIHKDLLPYTYDVDSIHQIMVNLKNEVQPGTELRLQRDWNNQFTKNEVQLGEQATLLRLQRDWNNQFTNTPKKADEVERWTRKWDTLYDELRAINAPEVYGRRPLVYFVSSLEKVSPHWKASWMINLLDPRYKDLAFKQLTTMYRDYVLESGLMKSSSSYYGAFNATPSNPAPNPSLQGRDQKGNNNNWKTKPPTCQIEGSKHWYSECPYICPTARTKDWKPKPDLQAKYDKLLKEDAKFKEQTEKAKAKAEEKASNKESPTFGMAFYFPRSVGGRNRPKAVQVKSRTFVGPKPIVRDSTDALANFGPVRP